MEPQERGCWFLAMEFNNATEKQDQNEMPDESLDDDIYHLKSNLLMIDARLLILSLLSFQTA
jgi:hypothetical protein